MRRSYRLLFCVTAFAIANESAFAMGSFLDRWNERYSEYTDLGESDAACQICHVAVGGGSTNGWNGYGWKVFELLESRKPFDLSDLDYAYDFAGLANSDQDQSESSNLTEIQSGHFPGWSPGNVNSHYLGSPSGTSSVLVNQLPPPNLMVEQLDPPAKVVNPVGQLPSGALVEVKLTSRLSGLSWPRHLRIEPTQPNVLFIVNLDGQIIRFDTQSNTSTVFVDLNAELSEPLLVASDASSSAAELGLLNMVFAPDFATSQRFYTFHTESINSSAVDFSTMPSGFDAHHNSVVTEWTVLTQAGGSATSLSARTLLRVAHPQAGNGGGGLHFDSDNTLLIGLGDGGGVGDQDQTIEFNGTTIQSVVGHGQGNASDLSNPLGSVLRIAPQGSGSANGQYGIPNDNPFVGTAGQLDEIFAYGFRNPSQIHKDKAGGVLIADQGEVAIDEFNHLESAQFYGWNQSEGDYDYLLNGLDASYLSNKNAPTNNEQLPFLALGRTVGQGFSFQVSDASLAGLDFDGLLAVRNASGVSNNVKLLGVDFGATPDQHRLTRIKYTADAMPPELIHSIKTLADGRVFIAANTTSGLGSDSGVVYELLKADQEICIPIKSGQTGRVSVICL